MKTLSLPAFAVGIALVSGGCNSAGGGDADAGDTKAVEEAVAELKEPVALIAAYIPYLKPSPGDDKFLPRRQPDVEKATVCAANEIRHGANQARQKIGKAGWKDLEAAFLGVATDCTDASEPEASDKCDKAVKKLDGELQKTAASSPAAAKIPRIAPESITEDAKKRIAPFLKAKGPTAADKAYVAKRNDPAASPDDVFAACQAAADDADKAAKAFDKADEPIRLIAVTRKMSMDSQCGALTATSNLAKEVKDCSTPKKAKTVECKLSCSKAKQRIEEGLPAAAFAFLQKDVADNCKE